MADHYFSYISSKANWDCVKTYFLCVPAVSAISEESIREFAQKSGWIREAEEKGAVLIAPVVKESYSELGLSYFAEFYERHKNDFHALSGQSIPGRDGVLWLWEVMIYLIGYEEGADYAAEVLTKEPGFFAAATLVNGKIGSFIHAEEEASHWFVRHPSDYFRHNNEIASCVWLFEKDKDLSETIDYFCGCASSERRKEECIGEDLCTVYENEKNPAEKIIVSSYKETEIAGLVNNYLFEHTLRWKNGPDGQLRNYSGKEGYQLSERFHKGKVENNGYEYTYSIYLPKGLKKAEVKGLPLVFSMHGRGEPAWVFAEKNGWDHLADETKEFIVVFPDSPYNIWTIERDRDVLLRILEEVKKEYDYDESRVYLSGFSNGAIFTYQQASTFPSVFAAASPWNGPGMEFCRKSGLASYYFHPDFIESETEMPFWIIVGDSDSKASAYREDELEILLKRNHCERERYEVWDHTNHYTAENGYQQKDRFHTLAFYDENGVVRVGLTVMKNMPHGAVWDESRAAWEFMKQFKRIRHEIKAEEESK